MKRDFRGRVFDHLVEFFDRRLLIGPKGSPRADLFEGRGAQRRLIQFGGFLGPAAAQLALEQADGNPFVGRDDLLDLAMRAGDRLVIDHAGIGTPRYPKPNHFELYPLAPLYELAAEHAGARRRGAWRDTMAGNCRAIVNLLDRTEGSGLGRPHPWSGTGANHFFGWLGVACRQARLLEDDALLARIDRAMRQQLRLQAPGGYFPEHVGPACVYHTVSLEGLAMYHRERPDAKTTAALDRGVAFIVRAIYPNGRLIETFDERNRFYGKGLGYGGYLVWTAEGRSLLLRNMEEGRRRWERASDDDGPAIGVAGHLHRVLDQATVAAERSKRPLPVRALPIDREAFSWKLEDRGLVRKQGPWFYALSAWPDAIVTGNPYFFERTQSLSVYHADAGLIVGGGNDKYSPVNATVCVVEAGVCFYSPPMGGRLEANRPARLLLGGARCDRLVLDYGAARATLELAIDSPRRLRIACSVWSNMVGHEVYLTLQLPLAAPVALRTGGKPLRLGAAKKGQDATPYALARDLELPGDARVRFPGVRGAQLLWPHLPWNPYRPPLYRADPPDAVALLRIPVVGPEWKTEISIDVG